MIDYAPNMHNCGFCGTEMEKQYRTCRNCKAVYRSSFKRLFWSLLIAGTLPTSFVIGFWQTYQAGKFSMIDILLVPVFGLGSFFIAYKLLRNCLRRSWFNDSGEGFIETSIRLNKPFGS